MCPAVASNTKQVLAATPHKAPTIRPPVSHHETIKVRQARHAGHCYRSRDELICNVLLWTVTYGRAKAGRPARTYIQQLCEYTGCSPKETPEAMNDREKWRERVRDIRASGTTWWWWWCMHKPESVQENNTQKLLWDFEIQTEHLKSARQPDIVTVYNKKWELAELWTLLSQLTTE